MLVRHNCNINVFGTFGPVEVVDIGPSHAGFSLMCNVLYYFLKPRS